jgi:hypothetical protein
MPASCLTFRYLPGLNGGSGVGGAPSLIAACDGADLYSAPVPAPGEEQNLVMLHNRKSPLLRHRRGLGSWPHLSTAHRT